MEKNVTWPLNMIYHKSFLKLDEKKRHMAAEYDIPQIIPKVGWKKSVTWPLNMIYHKSFLKLKIRIEFEVTKIVSTQN